MRGALSRKICENLALPTMKTFAEFWPYYVRAHSRPLTRVMHAVG